MERICIIGAGQTGRGFLARLAHESNVKAAFIDKDEKLVQALKKTGGYEVRFFGDVREPVRITDYTACGWEDADLAEVGTILVSVGQGNLADVGHELQKRLLPRKNYRIVTCENAAGPAQQLQDAIGMPDVRVSEAAVFCTTTSKNLSVLSENYPYLPFDAGRLPGYIPEIAAMKPTAHFQNFLKRKIYTYNSASGVIAYLGWIKGYEEYAAAANDPEIRSLLDRNYSSINNALCKEFGYNKKEQEEFARLSLVKFSNPEIEDTISRNARQALRKLGPEERIFGPMELVIKHGEDSSVLVRTAAAALLYAEYAENVQVSPEEILERAGKWMDLQTKEKILFMMEELKKAV